MPVTQLSFPEFALAQQAASVCTPPASPASVLTLDGGLVAQTAASGGECTRQFDFWVRRLERSRACAVVRVARFVGVYSPYGLPHGMHGPAIHSFSGRARAFNASRSVPGVVFLECAA